MIIWLDAQLPPSAAAWITATFGVETRAVRDLGLRDAIDPAIFQAADATDVVVMTKDSDFVEMLERFGPAAEGAVGDLRQYVESPAPRDPHPPVACGGRAIGGR